MTDLLKVKGLDRSHMLGKKHLGFCWCGVAAIILAQFESPVQPSTQSTHQPYTGAPPSGFSSQLSRSARLTYEGRSESAGFWPWRWFLLIRMNSGAGNTQHLLASAAASWVTASRRERTVLGCLFVLFPILCSTCYVRHLVLSDRQREQSPGGSRCVIKEAFMTHH